ncbi:hypothetical protein ACFWNK_38245 [Streptomyces sp. NPDC058417]|uniref:hypothetical protein n=1 Tax=unclassified Streptomyces TaxID=2593676 RepID=UPI0036491647
MDDSPDPGWRPDAVRTLWGQHSRCVLLNCPDAVRILSGWHPESLIRIMDNGQDTDTLSGQKADVAFTNPSRGRPSYSNMERDVSTRLPSMLFLIRSTMDRKPVNLCRGHEVKSLRSFFKICQNARHALLANFMKGLSYGAGTGAAGLVVWWLQRHYGG